MMFSQSISDTADSLNSDQPTKQEILYKCVRQHKWSFCYLTPTVRRDGYTMRLRTDQAQGRLINWLSDFQIHCLGEKLWYQFCLLLFGENKSVKTRVLIRGRMSFKVWQSICLEFYLPLPKGRNSSSVICLFSHCVFIDFRKCLLPMTFHDI